MGCEKQVVVGFWVVDEVKIFQVVICSQKVREIVFFKEVVGVKEEDKYDDSYVNSFIYRRGEVGSYVI